MLHVLLPVLQWGAACFIFKGVAEIVLAGKSTFQTYVNYGHIRSYKKIFCLVNLYLIEVAGIADSKCFCDIVHCL